MTESLITRAQAALGNSQDLGFLSLGPELIAQAIANKVKIEALEMALAKVELALKNAKDVSVLVSQWDNSHYNTKHEALMVKAARAALKGSTP